MNRAGVVVAGVDGCRAGWFVVVRYLETERVKHYVAPDFREVLDGCDGASVIAVDIPIGLLDSVEEGGRPADRYARKLLGRPRSSSVFSPPCRPALTSETYEQAAAATRARSVKGRSLTRQSFHLFRKLREVDALMTPERQEVVREAHPELSFAAMNGGHALVERKIRAEGRRLRIELLRAAGFASLEELPSASAGKDVNVDDVLDAYVCCWTAMRIARGDAERIPENPTRDPRGLLMEMWF
ncbi:MAG: DUF429 domain-containing protein [Actinomycetia bacterium]|nr:DUF429 domain-containing protein [Actinomycetes bacterium]